MKKYYKKLVGKREMVEAISSLSDLFDTEAMVDLIDKAGPRRLYIVQKGKPKPIACDNFKKFISVMSVHGKLDIMYPICFNRSETYHIFSKTDYFETEPASEDLSEDLIEELQDTTTENKDLPETIVEDSVEKEDTSKWDKYEELYNPENKNGSKKRLALAAKKDFKLDIKKNKPFEDMLEELKSKVEV